MRVAALLLIAAAAAQAQGADAAARVDSLLSWTSTHTPGCAVGVSRDARVIFERGYGMANLETGTPITPATVSDASSIAKQVTAMSVLLLQRDGKLRLDDDVRRWIPELPDYGATITIRHLLTHTSGLRDFFEMLILARGRFEEERITAADALDVVTRQRTLNFTPGAEYLYSNTGYLLAGLIVERASGQPLRQFAEERIFAPLGMTHTVIRDEFTRVIEGRAEGYAWAGTRWRISTPNYSLSGPTNLFTTVGDLLRWTANLDRPVVGDSAIVRAMQTSATLTNGDSTNYGLGLSLWTDGGARVTEHEGGDPGYRSYLGRYPDLHFAVAVLCNAGVGTVGLAHDIAGIFLDTLLHRAVGRNPAANGDAGVLQRRAGIYFNPVSLEVVELTVRDGKLYTARRGGRELIPLDSNRFAVAGRDIQHVFGPSATSGYVASSPGYHSVTFEHEVPFAWTPNVLTKYEGTYWSDELQSRYAITASDSTLLLKTGTSTGLVARPVFGDTFTIGQLTVQFTRRGSDVTGFQISHPRARRMAFVRIRPT